MELAGTKRTYPFKNGGQSPQRGLPGRGSGSAVAFLSSLRHDRPFQGCPAPPRFPRLVFILCHQHHTAAERRPAHVFGLSGNALTPLRPPRSLRYLHPRKTNTGPGFNRGSGGGARGNDFDERAGAWARTEGGYPIAHDLSPSIRQCLCVSPKVAVHFFSVRFSNTPNTRARLPLGSRLGARLVPRKKTFFAYTQALHGRDLPEEDIRVSRICDITAHDLARTHVSYYNDDSKRTKGMYRQRIQRAWGATAHRG